MKVYVNYLNEGYLLYFYNDVLIYYGWQISKKMEANFSCDKKDLFYIIKKDRDVARRSISTKGDQEVLEQAIAMVGVNDTSFNIIEL